MNDFVGTPPYLRHALCVAMETLRLHIAYTPKKIGDNFFFICGVLMNTLAPIKTCHVQDARKVKLAPRDNIFFVFPLIFTLIFKFSLIFMNMQIR